jgi:outer membrane protein assembly factor BamD (BamD/ComL family)
VNDALDYMFLITNYLAVAAGDLKLLGRAEALARRNLQDSSLALVSGLRGAQDAPLAPRATFLAGQWHSQEGHLDSALAIWDGYAVLYPSDPDAPRALWLAARLCEEAYHKPQEARSRYSLLLERYPRCHWVEEARGRIRKLDGS